MVKGVQSPMAQGRSTNNHLDDPMAQGRYTNNHLDDEVEADQMVVNTKHDVPPALKGAANHLFQLP